MGTTSLGTTTNGSLDGELLALEVVAGISMGIILQCLEGAISISAKVVGGDILLVEALTFIGSAILVTPIMGTEGVETGTDEAVAKWRGTEEGCADVVCD